MRGARVRFLLIWLVLVGTAGGMSGCGQNRPEAPPDMGAAPQPPEAFPPQQAAAVPAGAAPLAPGVPGAMRPPDLHLAIDEGGQTAGLGSYSWQVVDAQGQGQGIHIDAFALRVPQAGLVVPAAGPWQLRLAGAKPAMGVLRIYAAMDAANQEPGPEDGTEMLTVQPESSALVERIDLPLAQGWVIEPAIALDPGIYFLEVGLNWPGKGPNTSEGGGIYGFHLVVQADGAPTQE